MHLQSFLFISLSFFCAFAVLDNKWDSHFAHLAHLASRPHHHQTPATTQPPTPPPNVESARAHPRYLPQNFREEDVIKDDFVVSPREFEELTDKVMKSNKVLLDEVLSRDCKISVDFEGNVTLSISVNPPVKDGEHFPGTICLVHQGSDPDLPAIVTMVDKLSYLHSKEGWFGFINKAYYAQKNDRSFYIWVGKLPKESRPTYEGDRDVTEIRWFKCGEKRGPLDGVHALKLLAILGIFEFPKAPNKVLYLDSDMFVPFHSPFRPFYNIEQNFDDPAVFMIGNIGGNPRRKRLKLMNAGYIGAKNNIQAKRFLGLWWQSQCGLHDQLPLYLSMMAYYSSVGRNFTYSIDSLKLYHYGRNLKGALPYYYVQERMDDIRMGARCHNSLRKPLDPEVGFGHNGRLLVDDPVCGIVTTHVKQNAFCHCHLAAGKCNGLCAHIWPPPFPGAPLGDGKELEIPLSWTL